LLRLRWDGRQIVVELAPLRGPGRGAYLCAKMSCWDQARRRRALGRALRVRADAIDHVAAGKVVAGMISGSPRGTGPERTAPI